MSYFGFLAMFLGIPFVIMAIWHWIEERRGNKIPNVLHQRSAIVAILGHSLIALLYTTLWDNYLVATGVWWYDPELVTGLTIWYVPIEEYTFFVVQPIVTGTWLLLLMRYLPINPNRADSPLIRKITVAGVSIIWIASAIILFSDWRGGTYLGLELIWALPPIMLQLGFGADILWRHRNIVFTAILTATAFLSFADALAIESGTWTIDPEQSTGIMIAGVLPIEELLFFFLTNILIVFGVTLVLAEESQSRSEILLRYLPRRTNSMNSIATETEL